MKELSQVAQQIQPSSTLAIDSLFKQMKADGIDVIGFGAGEPDFDTPEAIKEAGITAIEQNFTRYTPATGILDLKQAICGRLKTDFDLDYQPSQVVVANGAKHALYITLQCLVNPGDEVILPAPYWVSYKELIQMVDGVPVEVMATEDSDFKMTAAQLKAAITPKTKALILTNPSNPTGMVYDKAELEALAQVCVEQDIYVIADEIYCNLIYDNSTFTSFPTLNKELKEQTILINGVAKSYAMTGWRIGYAVANPAVAKLMSNYLSHSTGNPSSIAQKAAVEALAGDQAPVEVMRQAFEERRNHLVKRMNAIPKVSCLTPKGAFYIMMNLEELIGTTLHGTLIQNADDFANLFLKEGLVATVPGTGFGAPTFVRWSYATSLENIDEGLNRLEKFLAE